MSTKWNNSSYISALKNKFRFEIRQGNRSYNSIKDDYIQAIIDFTGLGAGDAERILFDDDIKNNN